jgi:hypothetical protein
MTPTSGGAAEVGGVLVVDFTATILAAFVHVHLSVRKKLR